MKKVSITLFTFVCAICMILGVAFMNVNTAKADTTGTTPTLSETKVMVSNEQDKMLLATAIKNYADVYKVGYEFTGDVTTTIAETNKYYTSISCGSDTLTPEDIFDESWAGDADIGMIIWEVDFEVATSYEFKAYALVGNRTDGGELYIPAEEVKVAPAEATTRAFYNVTFNTNGGSVIGDQMVIGGTSADELDAFVPTKVGYDFVKWQVAGEDIPANATVNENITVDAVWSLKDYRNYPIYDVAFDADVRNYETAPINIQLPSELEGYEKISAKLVSYTANPNYEITTAVVKDNGASVDIPKGEPFMGENTIILFMKKGEELASARIKLTKATLIIDSYEDLQAFHTALVNKTTERQHYVLGADVDWGGVKWEPGWNATNYNFWGTIDGRGYSIANYASHYGLFRNNNGTIKNLYLKPMIKGSAVGGGVCLLNTSTGVIENCVVEATVTGGETAMNFAGMVKNNEGGTIKNCIVTLQSYTAYNNQQKQMNAISYDNTGTISNCYAISKVANGCPGQLSYMYTNSVTTGLYANADAFFTAVTSLPTVDGWNNYWSITNGELLFKGVKVL